MKEKIHVHIADDHKILIDGIVALVNTEDSIEVEGYSLTGKQVIDWVKEKQTDVLILDINMPEADGFEVMRFIKSRNIKQKAIILSSLSDLKIVQEMIDLGAMGFLEKGSAANHIIKAIESAHKGIPYFSDEIQAALIKSYTIDKNSNDEDDELSERETAILRMIVKEYSTEEISSTLGLSKNTVLTYRKRLHKKLKVKSVVGLAMYAVKNNIV